MVNKYLHALLSSNFKTRLYFPKASLLELEELTRVSETKHAGQVRVAIESSLALWRRFRGQTTRQRAEELFGSLGIWNTEKNCGVLLYLNISARSLEIVADRGISRLVSQSEWDAICAGMSDYFKRRKFMDGLRFGISEVTKLLSKHFPLEESERNELSDEPVLV